jgi:hypothetical protein
MTKTQVKIAQVAGAVALALSAIGATAGVAQARDWDDYGRRNIVRCDRDRDFCVVYRCDRDGDDCRVVRRFHRGEMRRYGYRYGVGFRDYGRYGVYGDDRGRIRCDVDGDRCWRVRR